MDLNWKKLRHHEGSAVDVPEWVTKLAQGNAKRAYTELESAFISPGESCSAAAPTVALLFESLQSAKSPDWILRAVAQIVGNDQLQGWLCDPTQLPEDFSKLLDANALGLQWALAHSDEKVRSSAGFLLGTGSVALGLAVKDALIAGIAAEQSAFALASLLLAAGRFKFSLPASERERLQAHEAAVVRGAFALGALRSGEPMEAHLAGLEAWLAAQTLDDRTPASFWWWWQSSRLQRRSVALENFVQGPVVLAELCVSIGKQREWSDQIVDAAEKWGIGRARRSATEFLIHTWDLGAEPDGILKPRQQGEELRWLLLKLNKSRLFASAGYGIPACGQVRARWWSGEEPTIMESLVSIETGSREPLYWLCKMHKTYFREKAEQALGLSGFSRWQFHASRACGEYGPAIVPPAEILDELIQDAASDPRISDIGRIYADEMGERLAEWEEQEIRNRFGPANSALIVLPLVRAGVPWDARWESALAFDEDEPELGRRLFEAVPVERRDAYLTENPPALAYQLAFMDLWSSSQQVRVALETLQEFQADGEELSDAELEVERRIYALAEENPIFAAGIAEFKKVLANE